MQFPFALPSKLQAFSEEFMSAFNAEDDSVSAVPAEACADSIIHADSPAVQVTSLAETASIIASSIRALVPAAVRANVGGAHHVAPANSAAREEVLSDLLDSDLSCPDAQHAVDHELASFRWSSGSALHLSVFIESLRRNYMAFSVALLLLGLLLLYVL
jgi:hypothetical protein